jgi:hypothetical protein
MDGTYDETARGKAVLQEDEPKKKESRYISDMMKKATKRNYELELAHERKLAREASSRRRRVRRKRKIYYIRLQKETGGTRTLETGGDRSNNNVINGRMLRKARTAL